MNLSYFDLITPGPLMIPGVGSLKPPTLREISRLTYPVYETYLAFLSMSPEHYCTEVNPRYKNWFKSLSKSQAELLSMYDIAVSGKELSFLFTSIFQFFFEEKVTYSREEDAFLLCPSFPSEEEAPVTGRITKGCYSEIVSLILQFNHLDAKESVDLSKVKNKKGRKIFEKIQEMKKNQPKTGKKNPDLEIGNVISAVCTMHHSINYTNVWDMTIYQLWDTFHRLQAENAYEINRTMISVWGDKDKKFDFNSWFKSIQ